MTAQGRLRVGVNLLWLVPNVVGGSEEYTTRLLRALAERDPASDGLEITLFVIRPFSDAYPELIRSFPTVVCPLSGHSKGMRIVAEASWLLARARRHRIDLLHHAGGTIPLVRGSPSVLSIHDLQPLLMPSNFSGLKQVYLRRRLPPSARHSRLIVSPSDYTRRTIIGILDVEPTRTRVVPPGYTARLAEPPVGDPRAHYRLDRPFFLYPAITYSHKNHMTLVRAFAEVTAKGADTLLVLTHRADTMEGQVLALADALGVRDRVRRLGHVPRGDLDWLYTNAVALTFPSRFEGFGLPVLEAMGNGCPVIAASATALPEVVRDAGVLVDPDDVSGWAAAMFEVASDDDRRSMLVEAGRRRVGEFQWTASAEALVEAYRLGGSEARPVNLLVLCPHFAPDAAPTGEVMTSIVTELVARGHRLHVVTALPWYVDHRIEEGWTGRMVRHQDTDWGRITRVHPFPTDKRNIPARAVAFGGFTALIAAMALTAQRPDAVLAMSPPLTLGAAGWLAARARRAPFVFNIQDVFPDVAVELGVITNPRLIALASELERQTYLHADAVTVLSEDLRSNVASKIAGHRPERVRVIPNFVDVERINPVEAENSYRREFGLTGRTVVMYAGNVGFSQSLDLVLAAAAALSHEPQLVFVINGGGSARADLERRAAGLANVRFVDHQPKDRLPELLAAADVHVVPLRKGLARASVPSKMYSILAAGRPIVASVDPGTEVAAVVERAGAGLTVPPDDPEAFTKAIARLVSDREEAARMGAAGRVFVEKWASPAAVAAQYESLFQELIDRQD